MIFSQNLSIESSSDILCTSLFFISFSDDEKSLFCIYASSFVELFTIFGAWITSCAASRPWPWLTNIHGHEVLLKCIFSILVITESVLLDSEAIWLATLLLRSDRGRRGSCNVFANSISSLGQRDLLVLGQSTITCVWNLVRIDGIF